MTRRLLLAFWIAAAVALPLRAQEGFGPFTTDFPPEEFAARRAKVYDAIGDKAFAVIQGAPSPTGYTRFRQSNDFYYLCGIEVPRAYLLLDGRRTRPRSSCRTGTTAARRARARMLSAEDADEVKKLSGVDAVFGTDLLAEQMVGRYHRGGLRILFTTLAPAEGASMSRDLALRSIAEVGSDPVRRDALAGGPLRRARARALPGLRDPRPLADARRPAPDQEPARARPCCATRRSSRASRSSRACARRGPGQYEHELDAVGKFVFWRNGAQGDAYFSLIASGHNAWWPHYNAGKRKMEDGDFLLMDYAPDYGYYEADVTRMFPVNGKFSQGSASSTASTSPATGRS